MKTKIALIIVAVALFAACSHAQTNTASSVPSIAGGVDQIVAAMESSGLTTATNYSGEAYATYAPNIKAKEHWGAGFLAVFNLTDNVGTALGVDYLGHFTMVSGNVTLKTVTHPFAGFGGWGTNVAVTPFALVGIGQSFSGASGPTAIEDVGAFVGFGHLWGGQFDVGAAWGQWENAGDYSGERYHAFAGWYKGF